MKWEIEKKKRELGWKSATWIRMFNVLCASSNSILKKKHNLTRNRIQLFRSDSFCSRRNVESDQRHFEIWLFDGNVTSAHDNR